jgi:hypothetical protein
MSRILLAFALLTSAVVLRAQDAPQLHGRIEGRTYVSPTGAFKVIIPVLPELGGEITDTPNVVTFQDDYNVHVSIAVFTQDATQRWEMSTRGTKDYLAYFFANYVLPDFRQTFQGVQAETATYVPSLMNGSLLAYILIPGGSMFMDRVPQLGPSDKLPVAKRGNLVFVRSGDIFVISTELAERVIEGKAYSKTPAEEDKILRQRLEDIVSKITFLKPETKPAAPTTSATPAPAPTAGK